MTKTGNDDNNWNHFRCFPLLPAFPTNRITTGCGGDNVLPQPYRESMSRMSLKSGRQGYCCIQAIPPSPPTQLHIPLIGAVPVSCRKPVVTAFTLLLSCDAALSGRAVEFYFRLSDVFVSDQFCFICQEFIRNHLLLVRTFL